MTYEITINGYGGEVVLGKLTKEQYDFWVDKQDDDSMNSHLFWDPYEEDEGNPVTDPDDPRFLGYWHDIDSIEHLNGAQVDMCYIEVNDDNGNLVWETEEPNIVSTETFDVDEQDPGYYFKGWTSEKGNFYIAEIETDKFDPAKLRFYASSVEGDTIISRVEYNGEELDYDMDGTTGKGQGFELYEMV